MPRPKKTDSIHVRLPEKAKHKIEALTMETINTINNESAILIIDGLIAREVFSESYLKDNRKKFI